MKIALIGCNGFVGNYLKKYLKRSQNECSYVDRSNYNKLSKDYYDIVINSSMPSKRYWARLNPELDHIETVEKTKNIIENWNFKKLVQISSVSARCQTDTVYGMNKKK